MMRTFDVLVEQEISGWVTVEAEDADAARAAILKLAVKVPNQRERRSARQVLPRDPVMKHGRVMVTSHTHTCGPHRHVLLRLDCGHNLYVDPDTWFPDNPYARCENRTCRTNQAVAA